MSIAGALLKTELWHFWKYLRWYWLAAFYRLHAHRTSDQGERKVPSRVARELPNKSMTCEHTTRL